MKTKITTTTPPSATLAHLRSDECTIEYSEDVPSGSVHQLVTHVGALKTALDDALAMHGGKDPHRVDNWGELRRQLDAKRVVQRRSHQS